MSDTLNEIERRILGVLLEKSLAQPAYYPMTLNAVVVACNQKNNRDPLMELDEEAVWQTLEVLRQKGLVSKLVPGGSSRSDRFRHEVGAIFGWEKPQRAVMTELLIRGPQTVGELRTHANRMYAFENLDSVSAVLDSLMQHVPPHVVQMPRSPGQSAVRFMHLFYPEKDLPRDVTAAAAPAESRAPSSITQRPQPANPAVTELAELREAIEDLKRRVSALEERP